MPSEMKLQQNSEMLEPQANAGGGKHAESWHPNSDHAYRRTHNIFERCVLFLAVAEGMDNNTCGNGKCQNRYAKRRNAHHASR